MAETLVSIAGYIALVALAVSFIRIILGPTTADRVVALDAMTIISISLIAFIASQSMRIIYLDVATVYALISFLGVIAVARYIERGI